MLQSVEWKKPRKLILAAFWLLIVLDILSSLYWAATPRQPLQDLGSFLHSGAAYVHGVNPYAYHWWVFPQPISREALNLNPPISVYLFAALNSLDQMAVRDIFFLGSTVLFAVAVLILLSVYPEKRTPATVLILFALAGVWHMLGYLQIYAPLILAVVCSWVLMRRGNLLAAGALIGLVVAFKPNFAVWPVLLMVAGHRRVGASSLATAALVSAIPLIIDGTGIYRQWLEFSLSFNGIQWTSNTSLVSVGARFGSTALGMLLAGAAFFVICRWQHRTRPDLFDSSSASLLTVMLLGPVSWVGYTLFLLPVLMSRRWTPPVWAALILLAVPYWAVGPLAAHGYLANAIFGPVYAWAVLLMLVIVVFEPSLSLGRGLMSPERPHARQRAAPAPRVHAPAAGPITSATNNQVVVVERVR